MQKWGGCNNNESYLDALNPKVSKKKMYSLVMLMCGII